jgi:hypothetical protein
MNQPIQRQTYEMPLRDYNRLCALPPEAGKAYEFWRELSYRLGCDYRTVLPASGKSRLYFTALPLRHRRHWCWPQPLRCKTPVPVLES